MHIYEHITPNADMHK